MIARALDAGVPARWVAGDEVYGADPRLAGPWSSAASAMCWPSPPTAPCRSMRPPHRPPRSSPPTCPTGLAGPLGRRRRARPAPACLGLDRAAPPRRGVGSARLGAPRAAAAGGLVAAGALQPQHRRAGVLPLLR